MSRGELSGYEAPDWDDVRNLASRVITLGEPLALTDEVTTILRRTAREVAICEEKTDQALRCVPGATELLHEAMRRINDGTDRLMPALHRMYRLRDAGDLEGARQQMRDILEVEVVPHFRHIAADQLEMLDEMEW